MTAFCADLQYAKITSIIRITWQKLEILMLSKQVSDGLGAIFKGNTRLYNISNVFCEILFCIFTAQEKDVQISG